MKSGRLAVNVLIDLYNLEIKSNSTFDFINKTIHPKEADKMESRELLNDYVNWMPKHFENHNCDLTKLEKLEITIFTDFKNAIRNERNKAHLEFQISALTKWKVNGRDEEILEITQTELIPKKLFNLKELPRMTEF
jgi:hypothetical protein